MKCCGFEEASTHSNETQEAVERPSQVEQSTNTLNFTMGCCGFQEASTYSSESQETMGKPS